MWLIMEDVVWLTLSYVAAQWEDLMVYLSYFLAHLIVMEALWGDVMT
jgi:hypothetical protein